jgi:mannose-6-phosphate isomerase
MTDMQPVVFQPYLRPMVWGGRKLGELFSKPLPPEGEFGESWEISPHPHHVSQVAEGPLAGRTLDQICQRYTTELFGDWLPRNARFPLLIKLLDCQELLSIQVHPDDETARRTTQETFGKTESWVILQADPGAKVYAGFHAGVTREDVERRLAEGTLTEALHCFTPKPGDCLYLPAGTVHAVGGGVVMAEVQQASDATFRLHDWNRLGADGLPRQLHVQQALDAINWDAGPVNPVTPEPIPRQPPGVQRERVVHCPYFEIERVTLEAPLPPEPGGRAIVWMVAEGAAELRTKCGYEARFRRGDTVLVPASSRAPSWQPAEGTSSTTLLRVSLPDRG